MRKKKTPALQRTPKIKDLQGMRLKCVGQFMG